MALPLTNLTAHFDASDVDDLWQVNTSGTYSVHMVDNTPSGTSLSYWEDVEHAAAIAFKGNDEFVWRSSTPLMLLPCMEFESTTTGMRLRNDIDTANLTLASVISGPAFTILMSIYVQSASSNNATPNYNHSVLSDSNGNLSIYIKKPAGYKLGFFSFGNGNVVELDINLNTSYVLMFRQEGGNIYASINGGAETSAANIDVSNLSGEVVIGIDTLFTTAFDGRIGEIAFYNAALTGSNLTDAISYFTAKWLGAEEEPTSVLFLF